MSLFNPFNKLTKKPSSGENYLSLTLTPNQVLAIVWNFEGELVNVLGQSTKTYNKPESLIHECAIAIDNAAGQAKSDVAKVVFGLSSSWFENGELKRESQKTLKNLADDLDLEPQAFVSLATGINHLLKVEEGVTPHAVLVGIFGDSLETHLVQNNKVLETKTALGPVNIEKINILIKQLKHVDEDLPAKIVVYGNASKELTEKITASPYTGIFTHVPKVDIIDEKNLSKSTALAQAADILGHDPVLENVASKEESPKAPVGESANLGFIEGEDILEVEKQNKPAEVEVPKEEVNESIANVEPVSTFQRPVKLDPNDYAVDITQEPQLYYETKKSSISKPHLKAPRIPIPRLPYIPMLSPKKLAVAAVILILLFVSGTYVAGYTLSKAIVQVKVNAQTQAFDFEAKVTAGQGSNFDQGQVAGQSVKGSAEGSQKAVATGNKKTGTAAKGQVKVFNWDKQGAKSFTGGTELITKDGLKFKLINDIQVASRSATTPGETKTDAQAADIGPKYNIGSGQEMSIVGFDEVFYSAVTETAFTGGEEKQATVVSKDDLAKLEKELTASLSDKARNDLVAATQNLRIYDEAKTTTVTKKEFDKKADEETSLVNLNAAVQIEAVAFDESELKKYLASLANKNLGSSQLEARPENIDLANVVIKRQKDTLTITGKFQASLIPKLNEEELKTQIAGKSIKDARAKIKEIQGVSEVTIDFSPKIPFVESVPRNKSKITFKIET